MEQRQHRLHRLILAALAALAWPMAALAQGTYPSPTLQNLTLLGNQTIAGTAGVAGNTTLANLAVTGAATLSSTLAAAATGTWTNAAMNSPFAYILNGENPGTDFGAEQAYNKATSALLGGAAVPATASVYGANAVAGLITSASASVNAVGGYFQARGTVTGAKLWGINPLADDNGFASTIQGAEVDVRATNTGSVVAGVDVIGVFTGTQPNAIGVVVATTGTPWTAAFQSHDGASTQGLLLGSAGTVANSDGQSLSFYARDNSNTSRLCTIQALHLTGGANLALGCVAGNVVLNGTTQVSSLTVATGITAGVAPGVACTGSPTSSFATVSGIVTHC